MESLFNNYNTWKDTGEYNITEYVAISNSGTTLKFYVDENTNIINSATLETIDVNML